MSKTLEIFGQTFSNVKGFKAKDSNGGVSYYDGYPEYKWLRPEGWPDIDSLVPWDDLDNFEGCYFTYDNTGHNFTIASFNCTTDGGQFTVERGHIENGEFVVDTTTSQNSNTNYTDNYAECGYEYPIYFVYPTTEGKHITAAGHCNLTGSDHGLVNNTYGTDSPCIERAGHLPYLSSIGGGGSNKQFNTIYLVRDHMVWGDKKVITGLAQAWYNCTCLEEIDFKYWNTSNWEITSLSYAWGACSSIRSLDFSKLDVSNWNVTNWGGTFSGCGQLQILDLTGFEETESSVASTSTSNIFNGTTGSFVYAKLSPLICTSDPGAAIAYPASSQLVEYWPMVLYNSQNYKNAKKLSYASIQRILNTLPELPEGTTYTVTFDRWLKAKLSAEDIAIATNKGWTVG